MSSTALFPDCCATISSQEQHYKQCLALRTPSCLSLPSCSTSSSNPRWFYSIRSRRKVTLVRSNRRFPLRSREDTDDEFVLTDDEEGQQLRSFTTGASNSVDFDDPKANDWMSWTTQDEPIVSNLPPYERPRHNQAVHGKKQLDFIVSQENQGFPEKGNSSKGSMFTSRLGEILANFKKKNDGPGRSTGDSLSSSLEKQYSFPGEKSFNGERSIAERDDPTSFNLFASDPPIPWEADRRPPTKPQPALKRKTSSSVSSRSISSSKPSKSFGNRKPRDEPKLEPHFDALGSNRRIKHFSSHTNKEQEIQELRMNHKIKATGPEEEDKPVDPMENVQWVNSDSEDDTYTDPNYNKSQGHTNSVQIIGPTNTASWKHNLPDLPFEFQYSYTEAPKAPVVRFRENPYSPFGASTMERPWTGRAPLKPSKKKVPEFDSFNPPPKGKKGIKPVQDPGPFSEGQGPKPSKTREETLGEPLTKEEIVDLIEKCKRESRQVNLGRDGLTHNMLEIIHCHWKRRRVCKIKCKGVPTVDMDNVCFHLEDKTGGKIIYRIGGLVYLFRGRNYNYKDRPKIPLMLWKPATPMYPKLIQDAPGGLTKEEADRLRILGRKVKPIRRLGKNGVYLTLVQEVQDAFKVDDLVRIDCQGLNPSDYKKIGAKLRDLVPCVLLSFDKEHILMWRGKEIVSSDAAISSSENNSIPKGDVTTSLDFDPQDLTPGSESTTISENSEVNSGVFCNSAEKTLLADDTARDASVKNDHVDVAVTNFDEPDQVSHVKESDVGSSEEDSDADMFFDDIDDSAYETVSEDESSNVVMHLDDLWSHALVSGMAAEIDECDMNSESTLKKAKELAQSAPMGPIYTSRLLKKLRIKEERKQLSDDIEVMLRKKRNIKKPKKMRKKSFQLPTVEVPPMGGMGVDELARLLAPR